jgi:uncharacterized protein YigA (DUF484 family)
LSTENPVEQALEREAPEFSSEAVAEYLRRNPGFLNAHPTLLEVLEVPHPVGEAVSMVEYQVRALKARNEELKERLNALVRNARDNEDIGRRVHRLCLNLLQCNGIDETFACMHQCFSDAFHADFSVVRLFAKPADAADARLGEFVALQPGQSSMAGMADAFAEILRKGKPVCGELPTALLEHLLGEQAGEVRSGALVPLGGAEPFGVLALCSREPERFKQGTGTIFLQQTGDIVSRAVVPFLHKS